MSLPRVTRRKMLKYAGIGVGVLAAACKPQIVEVEKIVEKVVKETIIVEKEVVVEKEKVVTQVVEKEVTRVVEVEKAAEVKGTFWVLQKKAFSPSFNAWFRQEMVSYCKKRGWPLDISYMAGYTGGTPEIEKIAASVAAGTPADLIKGPPSITSLRQLYCLVPVSDVVETIEVKWGKTAASNYNDLIIDDQWWAVPYFQRSDGGWFQRSAFKDAGIDIHKIRQYTDLWEACLDVSKPDNELYGWGVTINRCGNGDWNRRRVMHGWGAYVQDESGDFVTFDSPEMVEAMTIMTNLYMDEKWAPMLPPGILSWTDGSNDEAYLAGRCAYTQNAGTVYAKAVKDNNPIAKDTGFHAPCGGPVNEEFNSLNANTWVILRGARNPEAARETIYHFMMSLDMMDGAFSHSPAYSLPAYTDLWKKSRYIKTDPTAAEQEKVAMDPRGINFFDWPGPAGNPAMNAANEAGLGADMIADILKGMPVDEAVKTCHDRMVKIFKEFGKPGEK